VLGAVGQMECVSARKPLQGPIATCARKACGAHNVTWSVGRTLRAGMEEGVTAMAAASAWQALLARPAASVISVSSGHTAMRHVCARTTEGV